MKKQNKETKIFQYTPYKFEDGTILNLHPVFGNSGSYDMRENLLREKANHSVKREREDFDQFVIDDLQKGSPAVNEQKVRIYVRHGIFVKASDRSDIKIPNSFERTNKLDLKDFLSIFKNKNSRSTELESITELYDFLNTIEYLKNQIINNARTTSYDSIGPYYSIIDKSIKVCYTYKNTTASSNYLQYIIADKEIEFPKSSPESLNFIIDILRSNLPVFMIPLVYVMYRLEEEGKTDLFQKITFRTPKGKVREVYNPLDEIKVAQRIAMEHLDIIYRFGSRYKNRRRQFAYIKGSNTKQALELHRENKFFMKTDIKQFFDNIEWNIALDKTPYFDTLIDLNIRGIGIGELVKKSLMNPVTGGIYLGSPLSGMITNFYMRNAIIRIENSLNKAINTSIEEEDNKFPKDMKFIASIYADDILISCNYKFSRKFSKGVVQDALKAVSPKMVMHPDKTHYISNNNRRALGIGVNHRDELIKPRKFLKKITKYGFRPLMEKLAHGKVDFSILTPTVVGQINEALRYEDKNGPLRKYINKFIILEAQLTLRGVKVI